MIHVYTLSDSATWDKIVTSFQNYDVYWLSGYVKAFQIHGDGEPILIFCENQNMRGINVVMKRDVAKNEHFKNKIPEGVYFDFATPYGYGGWLIEVKSESESKSSFEENDKESLFHEYKDWLEQNEIISEFVRFHPMIKNHEQCFNFYEVIQLGEVVHMDLTSFQVIWDNIISKNHNMIRKATKNGIKIYNGRFPEIYEQFRVIYNGTMDKDEAGTYYYFKPEFYASILDDLSHNAQVFFAEKEGKIIAASIMLTANGHMNYHLSGSLRDFYSLAPTNLLLYEAALWGCANGYKTLYLGGGVGSGEDNLFKFKKAFYRGKLNHFYIGKRIYQNEAYNYLLEIRGGNMCTSKYFPQYRGQDV